MATLVVPTLYINKVIDPANVIKLKDHLDSTYLGGGLLTEDVSNYAKGRRRAWLEREWDLRKKSFIPATHDDKLWGWLKRNVWPEAQVGLVAYGDIGISLHRDDSYADWMGMTVNLGQCRWAYEVGYLQYAYGPNQVPQAERQITELDLPDGAVLQFNTKNRHGVVSCAPDRWSINLWKLKV